MNFRYPRLYRALIRAGHSAVKALEILFDAKRGDTHARNWVRLIARIKT